MKAPSLKVATGGHVTTVLLSRPPHNFADVEAVTALADALHALEADGNRRAVVLGSEGKSFCADAGAGLALVADVRIARPASRFSVNFTRLGFHPGFGLSCTLPRLAGPPVAAAAERRLPVFTGR